MVCPAEVLTQDKSRGKLVWQGQEAIERILKFLTGVEIRHCAYEVRVVIRCCPFMSGRRARECHSGSIQQASRAAPYIPLNHLVAFMLPCRFVTAEVHVVVDPGALTL